MSETRKAIIVTNTDQFKDADQYLHNELGHEKFLIEGDIVEVSPLLHYMLFSDNEKLVTKAKQIIANAAAMSPGTHERQYRLQRTLLQGANISYSASIAQKGRSSPESSPTEPPPREASGKGE